ncbi:MAG: DNA polymerase I [Alphaproteobacteria bacterium]|nr:DNA polymerase I [Alphaproteobacteria bacterium]
MSSAAKPKAKSAPKHVYLVDGSGYIFRAFFALPPMTRADGTPVNAVFGFVNMLMKLVDDAEADPDVDYIAVFFDSSRESFRNEIYPDYKGNRPDAPEELIPQFPLIRDATRALTLPSIEMEGYEADDLIATYAKDAVAKGAKVTIVSSDKDLMQLVGDGVAMHDPMKNRPIGPDEVREKFGVDPDKVVDVQALAGDSSDNVPGVPGIGVKTAADLIGQYGDLETLLARAEEIKQPKRRERLIENAELARVSKQLVTLRDDVPVEWDLEEFALKPRDTDRLIEFLKAQDFKKTLARVEARLAESGAGGDAGAAAAEALAPGETAYELVQTVDALESWIGEARREGLVAVDTETTSLDAMQAELVGVSLSIHPGRACYIPLAHRDGAPAGELDLGDGGGAVPEQIPMRTALELLKPLLQDPAVLKVGQNLKYDMLVLSRPEHLSIQVAPVDDTMLLSFVTEAGLHGHGMDDLAELHLGHTTIKFSEVAGSGRSQLTFDRVPLDKARDYAAEDADVTGRLYRVLKSQLVADRMVTVYETIERPLIPVLVAMERAGIRVDRDVLSRLSGDFAQRIAGLEEEIFKLAGHEFTIGSPKQLGEVLFDEMSLPGGKKGKTGAYATGADVLEQLVAQGHDLPARVLDWRQLSKLKSTYTDTLIEQINPDTGRVHTSFHMAGAATGRLASTDPNLQNIPVRTEEGRKIREAFVAAEGCRLVSLDYSQIELRLLAHVAGIDALKQAFHDGADIHAMTASQVFGVPMEGMDPLTRRRAKAINFGIIYGISAFGLAKQLDTSKTEAQKYIDAYFERYPGIRDYMDRARKQAAEHGFVKTPFGRKIHIPGIKDKNPARRNFSERAAINAPLQGGAADVIKRAMIRVPAALAKAKLGARMLLQVHDELLFDVPDGQVDETVALVKQVMEGAAEPALSLSVPITVDAGTGDNWAAAH